MYTFLNPGPDLPRPMAGHCFQLVSKGGIFLFDGRNDHGEENTTIDTYLYENETKQWKQVMHNVMLEKSYNIV